MLKDEIEKIILLIQKDLKNSNLNNEIKIKIKINFIFN
jgi:hypothetical protein